MTRNTTVFASLFTSIALVVIAGLSACSGAVGGSPPVNDPTRITILPAGTTSAPVTAYSGLPTTFTIAGGTGAYFVSSDNQAVINVSGAVSGTSFTVVPSPVLVTTTVTLTVRDTGTAPVATSIVTVQPGTVNNNITITPTSSLAAACTPAICSGGDALVSVTISQGGVPLAARGVRFDVLSGSFSFVSTDPVSGAVTLVNTIQVTTDETGKAIARIRIPAGAQNQTALLQVTDIGTGTFQRTSFAIAQSTGSSPGFSLLPSSIVFQGVLTNQCAGVTGDIFGGFTIIGGTPPYTITGGGSAIFILPDVVTQQGGTFDVKVNGTCIPAPGLSIVATDATGHTATATVENLPGTGAAPALTVTPSSITLTSCSGQANATVAGGVTNNYFASGGSDALTVVINGNTVTVSRRNPSAAVAGPLSVGVSDGSTSTTLTVNLSGEGAGACPALVATPSSVTLTNCTTPETVTLSGGTGTYTAASDNASVQASVSASTLTIVRTSTAAGFGPSGPFTPPAHVTVRNGTASTVVNVNATGTGQPNDGNGSCP
ncbi:MAG TPA: hypothetical protein VKR38_16525 [Usitatibacter sp.]|nr:hypothetical protein [Usitatibacter sp.]